MFLVCGEALYDVFAGPPDARGGIDMRAVPGGSALNVALGLARLGVPTAFFGGLSRDLAGDALRAVMTREGIAHDLAVTSDARTTLSLIALDARGVPHYTLHGEGAADRLVEVANLPELVPEGRGPEVLGLHLGSFAAVVPPVADALAVLAARAHAMGLPVSLDPNVRLMVEPDPDCWKTALARLVPFARLVKASAEDLALLWPGRPVSEIAAGWLAEGPALVVVTRGAEGAEAFARGGGHCAVPAEPAVVLDTVGAGDSVQATLLATLLEEGLLEDLALAACSGDRLASLLRPAMQAAALTCARRGADPPTRAELDAALAGRPQRSA